MRRAPCAFSLSFLLGCTADPVPVDRAYEVAVERCRRGEEDGALDALGTALQHDPDAAQRALLEPAFHSGLRDTDAFREAIHDAAVRHRISDLDLVGRDEPGEWIEIEGLVVDPSGAPVPGAIVRVFATDREGRYHPTIEGERLPRIFGTLVSDENGRFRFRTVRPGPYPGTRNARHIHVSARAGDLRLARPHYAVFDDDPLLWEPENAEQRGEAIRIAMRTEGGRAIGALVLPMR